MHASYTLGLLERCTCALKSAILALAQGVRLRARGRELRDQGAVFGGRLLVLLEEPCLLRHQRPQCKEVAQPLQRLLLASDLLAKLRFCDRQRLPQPPDHVVACHERARQLARGEPRPHLCALRDPWNTCSPDTTGRASGRAALPKYWNGCRCARLT